MVQLFGSQNHQIRLKHTGICWIINISENILNRAEQISDT